jgi:small subunit ribosomal protein S6
LTGPRGEARMRDKDDGMALYEHVFIARQDITNAQAEGLIEHFGQILKDNGGDVAAPNTGACARWPTRSTRTARAITCSSSRRARAGRAEMERLMRLHEDVMRVLTVKVEEHEEGDSAIVRAKNSRDDRGRRGGRGRRDD